MKIQQQSGTAIYSYKPSFKMIQPGNLPYRNLQIAPKECFNKTSFQRILAKCMLKYHQFLGGYNQSIYKDFENLWKRTDVSFKDFMLYLNSGVMHFSELLNVNSLENLKLEDRKSLLKKVVKDNISMFTINPYIIPEFADIFPVKLFSKKTETKLREHFPLLPQNENEYSNFIKQLVNSINIKTEKLSPQQIERFNESLDEISIALKPITDEEFERLDIRQIPAIEEILKCIPELKPTIGRKQHGAHDFDVFKHSLKVLKKISEDPNFQKLDKSDKKIMLMAALMHDITKKEGVIDDSHPLESSFQAYYISKRFNLTSEETKKIYKLIKNHEWLKYINVKSAGLRKQRMRNIAWELMADNLFEMSLIFTHADLRAVKKDDTFHEFTGGKSQIKLNGRIRSFGESADIYAENIRKQIVQLQSTQPLIPMTPFPKASRIKEAISEIKPDGSTNIKGVYVDNDGLVILKFNEIEEWEKIGFPRGSTSKGIIVSTGKKNQEVETGNIKFLAHALDYEQQLARFCAFNLPDSMALLSVSYAERPETKYRFFRPQGLLGYTDTFNIIGGGATDAGSGYKKNLKHFRYRLDEEKSCRTFIPNLLKRALDMNDNEYIELVLNNKNSSYTNIHPESLRNKMIQVIGQMKSKTRLYGREYNEFFASDFQPMSPFAYNTEDKPIENPILFVRELSKTKGFLREYALNQDFPYTVLGV